MPLVKRCIPYQKISIKYWSVLDKSTKKVSVKLRTFDELYPVKKLFFL